MLTPSDVVACGIPAPRPTKKSDYREVRPKIGDGDLLFFAGRNPLSRLIEWSTKSGYSHIGITAWWGDRLFVFQAELHAIEVAPASRVVSQYDGRVDWWRLRDQFRPLLRTKDFFEEVQRDVGLPYSVIGLIKFAWHLLDGRYRPGPNPKKAPPMFCSQYVARCFDKGGLDLVRGCPDAITSPGDLARCSMLESVSILRSGPKNVCGVGERS